MTALSHHRVAHLRGRAAEIEADAEQLADEIAAGRLDHAIICASTIEDNISDLIGMLVASFRDHGATWEQVAAPLGVTRQSAWERFRHVDPPIPHPSEG